jgi:putative phosphonate metabolism protein
LTGHYSGTMETYPRYAIYYAPAADGALSRFGARMLGYDAFSGRDLAFPDDVIGSSPDWRDLTQDPRKYGFHATLKAPMTLAKGRTEADLATACAAFAGRTRRIPVIEPVVDSISGFVAVIPTAPNTELMQLAADVTREFDAFRAPLTAEDRARRNPSKLTPRQREYLDCWGYPYVMEDYRFHMTLTGRLDAERREHVMAMLRRRFAETGLRTLAIDRIALFRQDAAASRFHIIRQEILKPGYFQEISPTEPKSDH